MAKNYHKEVIKYGYGIVTTVVCFLILHIGFGFGYEALDDPQFKFIASYYDSTKVDFYNLFHINGVHILSALYSFLPNIPWFDLHLYFWLAISIVNLSSFIKLRANLSTPKYLACIAIICLAILPDYILIVNTTRIGILLCASTLLLVYELINRRKRLPFIFWPFALIPLIVATDFRVESITLVVLLVYVFFILEQGTKIFKVPYKGISLLLLIAFVYGFSSTTIRDARSGLKAYAEGEPYVFALIDMHYLKADPLLETDSDKLKYRSVTSFFLPDREVISADYLSTITTNSILDLDKLSLADQYLRKVKKTLYYLAFNYWLIILLLIALLIKVKLNRVPMVLSTSVLALIILLAITYLVKMEWRLAAPIMTLGFFLSFSLISNECRSLSKPQWMVVFIVLGLFGAQGFFISIDRLIFIDSKQERTIDCISSLSSEAKGGIAFDVNTSEYLLTSPFQANLSKEDGAFYMFDSPYLSLPSQMGLNSTAYIDAYMEQEALPKYWLTSSGRIELLQAHLRVFHNKEMVFEDDEVNCNAIYPRGDDPKLYQLVDIDNLDN